MKNKLRVKYTHIAYMQQYEEKLIQYVSSFNTWYKKKSFNFFCFELIFHHYVFTGVKNYHLLNS